MPSLIQTRLQLEAADALLALADPKRQERSSKNPVEVLDHNLIEGDSLGIQGRVQGVHGVYDVYVTLKAGRRAYRCSCPDSLRRGREVGPCKHTFALAKAWRTELNKEPEMIKTASLSRDGKHRLELTRCWDKSLPRLGWIMLNPSTADAELDDPTIRKCIGFAERWGYGSIAVGNLFSYRTKSPAVLKQVPVNERNDADANAALVRLATRCEKIVVGWGANGAHYARRIALVKKMLFDNSVNAVSLEITKQGHPKHPLYIRYDIEAKSWL